MSAGSFTGNLHVAEKGAKARFFSPRIQRFVQADTIVPGATNPQNWNRYSYVLNSPANHVDPTGHCVGPIMDDERCYQGSGDIANQRVYGEMISPTPPPDEENRLCNSPMLCPGDTPDLDGENIIEILMASVGVEYRGEDYGYCIPTLQKDDDDYLCQGNGTYWDWWLKDYMPLFWHMYGDEISNGYSLGSAVESVLAKAGIALIPPYLDSGLIFTINFGYSYFEEGNSVQNSIGKATLSVGENIAVDTASLIVGGGAGLAGGGICASSGVGIAAATACFWGGFGLGYGVENALASYGFELANQYIVFPVIDVFIP